MRILSEIAMTLLLSFVLKITVAENINILSIIPVVTAFRILDVLYHKIFYPNL